ncbi:Na+/H+ antiporter NhaA [Stieleria sp. JC731]|uniref:Na+/H+ antiporter NhaA n=1 Tax=Pirellulaceae TaxID=2691357 RepID=UPI001E46B46F|nr:Na+/H+ antiporter NhaA [Stieleria sp. JC731]MCC9600213.1 Na+/H+ antiporter NhaA [Stieleria sp. JC731]
MSGHNQPKGLFRFFVDNSLFLITGAVIALIWANWAAQNNSHSYHDFIHFDVRTLVGAGESHVDGHGEVGGEEHSLPVVAESEAAAGVDESVGADEHTAPVEVAEDSHANHDETVSDDSTSGESDSHDSPADTGHHWYSLLFIINDVLMALFFAIAAKEVWESLLPGGALSNPRKAATPLLATFGGIAGPALFFLGGAMLTGTTAEFGKGWAVPCATDIAFSYLVARLIFGVGHPAIAFLLLLAIADDAAGLVILAIFYPSAPIEPIWLLLTAAAMFVAWLLSKMKVQSHWFYILGPGIASWFSFYEANLHPALGLVPIIPLLPSASSDLGIFAREELNRQDTLNEFEHFWKVPVEIILGLFGLVNAGVVLSSVGTGTWLVLVGLLVGKPVGITFMTFLSEKVLRLEKPAGMDYRHVVTLGMVAGIGFTVALFVSVAAFKVPGAIQDSVKMGALLSFAAAPLSIVIAKALGVRVGDHLGSTNDVPSEGTT